jgi:glycosyltransferase involved in cell wall biosynthesis
MINLRAPMQVDVLLLTKNSDNLLVKCLNSIYRNVPVKTLIVIDGFSTDNTLKILEKFQRKNGNVFLVQLGFKG